MNGKDEPVDKIYLEVAKELKVSKFLVKEVVEDVFGFTREFLRNPSECGILLHSLGTFEAQKLPLKHMLSTKTFIEPKEKEFWENYLEKVKKYHKSKKRKVEECQKENKER